VNEFVEECRREWRRLRVPDAVANEMAADLEADLREAEAEGASAEEVLGSGAFDPRSFAASWAAERGVVPPPPLADRPPLTRGWRPSWRPGLVVGLVAFGLIALIGAAIAFRHTGSAQAIASPIPRVPIQPFGPGARILPLQVHAAAAFPTAIGVILLLLGIVGLTLTILYWSPWASSGQWSRRRSYPDGTPGGRGYY